VCSSDLYAFDGLGRSAAVQVNVQLAAADDAPVASSATLSLQEDTARVLSLADFSYRDLDGEALTRLSVHVDGPDKVALQYLSDAGLWETQSAGDHAFLAADMAGGRLRLLPAGNLNGAVANALLFDVFSDPDGDGAAPGQWSGAAPGSEAYVHPYSLSLNIAAVDDAPTVLVPPTQQANGMLSLVMSTANGNAMSVAAGDVSGSLSVRLVVDKGLGWLTLSSNTGLTFTDANGNDGTLAFSGSIQAINAALGAGLALSPGVAGIEVSGSDGLLTTTARVDVAGVTFVPGFYMQGDGSGGGGGGASESWLGGPAGGTGGGAGGGGARLTQAGQQLLDAAQRLGTARKQLMVDMQQSQSHQAMPKASLALTFRTSMRNQFLAEVTQLRRVGGLAWVTVELPDSTQLIAKITRESAQLLDLHAGVEVMVWCKATAVSMSLEPPVAAPANLLSG